MPIISADVTAAGDALTIATSAPYFIEAGVTLLGGDDAIQVEADGNVVIAGNAVGFGAGVESSISGVGHTVNATVTSTGVVWGAGTTGAIGVGWGFYTFSEDTLRLVNFGLIEGYAGAVDGGSQADSVTNHGSIVGDISLSIGNDTVINRGAIDGDVQLGVGNDTYDGRGGTLNSTVFGGSGDDLYIVDDPDIQLTESLGEGTDTVQARSSFKLAANFEHLTLLGDGNYRGLGNGLDNTITGNLGDNLLAGRAGNDEMFGEDGFDTLRGGAGNDSLDGGSEDDWLAGGAGVDRLYGGDDNDTLRGQDGNDILLGQEGNDELRGGLGRDVLFGGLGADLFEFRSILETPVGATRDRVDDFASAQGDLVDVSGIDANTGVAGDQAFIFIGAAAFSAAGQLRFDPGTKLVSGNVDGALAADFEIFVDAGAMSAGDFVL